MEALKELKLTQDYVSLDAFGKKYRLAFDAIAADKANDEINKAEPRPDPPINVANPTHWFRFSSLQLAIVVWACMDLFHSEVELKDVKRWIGPGSQDAVFNLLFKHTWPDMWERLNKVLERKGPQPVGEQQPNT